jgi:hypothetical protein
MARNRPRSFWRFLQWHYVVTETDVAEAVSLRLGPKRFAQPFTEDVSKIVVAVGPLTDVLSRSACYDNGTDSEARRVAVGAVGSGAGPIGR